MLTAILIVIATLLISGYMLCDVYRTFCQEGYMDFMRIFWVMVMTLAFYFLAIFVWYITI